MGKAKKPETGEGYLGETMVHRISRAVGVVDSVVEAQYGWPPEITWEAMAPHYETVGRVMNVQAVPDNQWSKKMQLVREAAEAVGLNRSVVAEDVFPTVVLRDETKTLRIVEPLHSTCCHCVVFFFRKGAARTLFRPSLY